MSRILLLGFLIFVLLLGGLASFHPGWLELAIPLLVYLLAGFLFASARLDLSVERLISDERVAPGQPVTVSLRITNHAASIRELSLLDPLPENSTVTIGSSRRLVSLKKGETLHWEYTFISKRGFSCFQRVGGQCHRSVWAADRPAESADQWPGAGSTGSSAGAPPGHPHARYPGVFGHDPCPPGRPRRGFLWCA